MSPNTLSSAPAENTSTLPPSPEAKLNTLERQVALANPNKPKVPPEDKPAVPFVSETPVVWQKSETSEMITPENTEEAKKTLWDRVRNMSAQFGTKITEAYENSKDAIHDGLKTLWGFIGMDKLKWWWEKMIGKLQWDGIFATLFGGKWGWAEKLLSKIFGIGDVRAWELPGTAKLEGKYAVTHGVIVWFLGNTDIKNIPALANPLSHPTFQKMTISELREMRKSGNYQKLTGVLSDQTISPDKQKELYDILIDRLLDTQNSFPAKLLSDSYKSGTKNATVEESMSLEWYFQWASRVIGKVKHLPNTIKNGVAGAEAQILKLKDGKVEWLSEDEESNFAFSNPETRNKYLTQMLSQWKDRYEWGKSAESIKKLIDTPSSWSKFEKLTAEEKNEMQVELKKLFAFGDTLLDQIHNNPRVNLGVNTANITGFSYRWLLSMYYIMNGNAHYDNMTTIERVQLHSLVTGIIGFSSTTNSAKITAAYANNLEKSAEHSQVTDFLIKAATYGWEKAAKWAWEAIKWGAVFVKESPRIWWALIALNLPLFTEKNSLVDIAWF
jgi:hypothetical protein